MQGFFWTKNLIDVFLESIFINNSFQVYLFF